MKSTENIKGWIEGLEYQAERADEDCRDTMIRLAKTLMKYAEKGDSSWFLAHFQSSAVEQIRGYANEAETSREKAQLLRSVLGE